MNILILGAYNSCNLGDAVICECVAHTLRESFPEAHIIIKDFIQRNRLMPGRESNKHSMIKRRIHSSIRRIVMLVYPGDWIARGEKKRVEANRTHMEQVCSMNTDLVVVAGGQLFMDRYALFLEGFLTRFAEKGIPVIINACGTGPNKSVEIAARLKATLMHPCVKRISCRDDVNFVNIRYLEAGKKAEATFDPALNVGKVYGYGGKKCLAGCIGLGVKEPDAKEYKKTVAFWKGVIRELEKVDRSWKFFTNGDPIDRAFAREVLTGMPEMKGREEELLRPCDIRPEELVETIRSFESLISFRLHSHIIACALDIPTVAVVWDEKLPAFFAKIGCPERCVTVDTLPQEVLTTLEQACEEGYNRERIIQQEKATEEWLLEAVMEAMEEVLKKEDTYESDN